MEITLDGILETLKPFPIAPRGYECNQRTFDKLRKQCAVVRSSGELLPRFTGTTIYVNGLLEDGIFRPIA